jgi:hypothetical protein
MKKHFTFFLACLFLFSACTSASPASTTEPITVQYTAAAQPWLADLAGCAGNNVMTTELRSADTLDINHTDVTIRIGEPSNLAAPTYQIGTDDILVIANRQNPIHRLTIEQVRGLFTGQIQNWKDIQGADAPVRVWVFASGEDVQQIFEQTSLGGTPVTSTARLATGPDEMAQAIANDINAIGVFTSHGNTGNVSVLFTGATVPVLATTSSEPQGALPQILACLQK